MSNDDLDIRNIIYANNNSKMTLKTKIILDDLAAQRSEMPFANEEESRTQVNSSNLINNIKQERLPNNRILKTKTFSNSTSFSIPSKESPINSKGIVKKKAAFFESLLTPVQNNKMINTPRCRKILEFPLDMNKRSINKETVDKENEKPVNVEEYLPPPPDYVTDSDDELIPDSDPDPFEHCTGELEEEKLSEIEIISVDKISEDFTCISSISSSRNTGSLYDEIVNELAKKQIDPDTESLPDKVVSKVEPKKVRRSLSFNDTVEYIFPTSTEDFSEDSSSDNNDEEHLQNTEPCCEEQSRSVVDSSRSFLNLTKSTEVEFCVVELEMEMSNMKKQSKDLLESLRSVLTDLRFHLGSKIHTDICRQIVKNSLVTKSLAEKIYHGPDSHTEAIVGTLKLNNVSFAVKDGYVLIDFDQLASQGYMEKLYRLSGFFHMLLYVRCLQDTVVSESKIYTLVSRKEAVKLGLKFQAFDWVEMFYYINFQKLSAGFRLVFDLHCMHVTTKKHSFKFKGTPKKRTPIKDLFSNFFHDNDRSAFFTNIGSFEVSAHDLLCTNDDDVIYKELTIPIRYPFTGQMKYNGSLELLLTKECEGRLNIYMDVGGVGSWIYRDCKVTQTSIAGGRKCEITGELKDIDMSIPFYMCKEDAVLCDYSICAKTNSFGVLLREIKDDKTNMPINRRLSTDGRKKNRFLACAESYEDTVRWCTAINGAKAAFCRWANDVDS